MSHHPIKNFILDTLFPIFCLSCGKNEEWLCPGCAEKIKLLSEQVCPYCEKNITSLGAICPNCQTKFLSKNAIIPLDNLIACAPYRENIIPRIIYTYKYNFVSDLSAPMGQILMRSILKNNLSLPDFIIPIPLHSRRMRWRGFNQSELLANYLSENLTPGFPIPVLNNFITRIRYTKPQMKIKNYQERQKNIKDIFKINLKNMASSDIKDKSILLVDDIATTGATLFECARVLKQNGARKVMGIVIARQEISS